MNTDRPETRYAWNGDVALAYQVVGDGPLDIVYLQGELSNIDVNWESPYLSRFLRGLARIGRLIATDRRGWGCSDRFSPTDVPPFESLTDDLAAVMDAAGSGRAAIFASFDCTTLALLFAAAHPERVTALVLCDALASWIRTDDMPWLPDTAAWELDLQAIHEQWGTPQWTEGGAFTRAFASERNWYTRLQSATLTPGSGVAEFRTYMRTDVRDILPMIQAPSLVLAGSSSDSPGAGLTAVENGRYVASRIPGARYVEMQRSGESPWLHWYGRAEPILAETGRFLASIGGEQASRSGSPPR